MISEKTQRKWKRNITCPICESTKLRDWGDICPVCSWENDPFQFADPTERSGANRLCLNDYRKRWHKLEEIMPGLIANYGICNSELTHWKYSELIVPRGQIFPLVNELSGYGIAVTISFCNICKQYGYDSNTFHGYPIVHRATPQEKNDEQLRIIFSKDPIETCKKYRLNQLLEILEKSENAMNTWKKLTPNISIEPNTKWKV